MINEIIIKSIFIWHFRVKIIQ